MLDGGAGDGLFLKLVCFDHGVSRLRLLAGYSHVKVTFILFTCLLLGSHPCWPSKYQ